MRCALNTRFHHCFVYRTESIFLKNEEMWLSSTVSLPKPARLRGGGGGRPRVKAFSTCSARSKRRYTMTLRSMHALEALCYALTRKLRASGNEKCAKVVEEICKSPSLAGNCSFVLQCCSFSNNCNLSFKISFIFVLRTTVRILEGRL